MIRTFLKNKIHRATVTEAELHYDGSVSIDEALLELADIHAHEQVDIYNITSGTRLTTYAIVAERNSGRICINGSSPSDATRRYGDHLQLCAICRIRITLYSGCGQSRRKQPTIHLKQPPSIFLFLLTQISAKGFTLCEPIRTTPKKTACRIKTTGHCRHVGY